MAYADHSQSSSRTISTIVVVLIHAVLGYAFVTGLGIQYVKKVATELNVIDVADEPPPPEEPPPPPPPPPKEVPPPPVYIPPPEIALPAPAPVIQSVQTLPPPLPPVIHAPPAPPPPPQVSKAASARGNPGEWFGDDDYPPQARRNGEEGSVTVGYTVDTRGRVQDCRIIKSSGYKELDEATCSLLVRRGRYKPAQDANGNPIAQSRSLRTKWQIR